MFKKRLFFLCLILLPFIASAETDWVKEAEGIDLYLNDTEIIAENDNFILRLLSWEVGYDHITTKIVIQKFIKEWENPEVPYKLVKSVYIEEFDPEYAMYFTSVEEEAGSYLIQMKGFHAYMYSDAEALISMDENLDYTVDITYQIPE